MDIEESAPREESDSDAGSAIETSRSAPEDRIVSSPNSSKPSKKCPTMENEALVGLMNRVCELCHDFFSHTSPNMRFKCR
jgi:hypothetical protein